jgi:hypothetical protein
VTHSTSTPGMRSVGSRFRRARGRRKRPSEGDRYHRPLVEPALAGSHPRSPG